LTETNIAIELRDIVKRFPGVIANDHVNLTVETGTIHAIVGENGSGKSTLMKTLYGAHRPDEGTIIVNGEVRDFKSPRDAIACGIGMVFQHFMLADNFLVWENVILGDEPGSPFALDIKGARDRIRQLSAQYGLAVDPDDLVADLGVGERQRVEILKVLFRGARIIILDEPTAVLVPHEVDELFASLRDLTAHGATVVFISHKLDEVLSIANAITVIRDGKTVAEIDDVSKVSARQLAELMVGSALPTPETRESTVTKDLAFAVDSLVVVNSDGRVVLDDVSFSIHHGEIVGIAGVEGNGQTELIRALIGVLPIKSGTISMEGRDITHLHTRDRRALGIGYVPEDRHYDGLVLTAPLWSNVALGHQDQEPFAHGLFLDRDAARERTRMIIGEYDVKAPSADTAAVALSGGNQQKLIIGREMTVDPKVLIAAHPTRGIDVGAQAAVWEEVKRARAAGLATLLISADLEELIGLSDSLLVMLRGKVVVQLDPAKVTAAELGSWMTGANQDQGAA
jgi:general nucleoside transport system ATP-binding protein